jgi:1-acyl-sn-glycerol-3-phosphate acyltransferase
MKVRSLLRSAAIWSGFAGVVLVAVPPMMVGYPLVLVDPNRAISDWWLRTLGKALVRVNPLWSIVVEGKEKLAHGGPYVLVVNHQSFVDLIAMCFLDHPTKYLGKESVFKVPVFGWALAIAGEVPVERGNRESGRTAIELLGKWLDRGVSVALFPEGTRSKTGEIGKFKLGAFRLAIDHGRPVVPIVLSGAKDVLPKGSFVFENAAQIRVQVLDPIDTSAREPESLADEVRTKMIEALSSARS